MSSLAKIDYRFNPHDGSFTVFAPTRDISNFITDNYEKGGISHDDRVNERNLNNHINDFVDWANQNGVQPEDFEYHGNGGYSVNQGPSPEEEMEIERRKRAQREESSKGFFAGTVLPSLGMALNLAGKGPVGMVTGFGKAMWDLSGGKSPAEVAAKMGHPDAKKLGQKFGLSPSLKEKYPMFPHGLI